jgi:hypothetical protein
VTGSLSILATFSDIQNILCAILLRDCRVAF